MKEVQDIMRQVTCLVTFPPIIDEACIFDLLAYTSIESEVQSNCLKELYFHS